MYTFRLNIEWSIPGNTFKTGWNYSGSFKWFLSFRIVNIIIRVDCTAFVSRGPFSEKRRQNFESVL